MDLFSCCWESQKPCFCPFAPSSVHSSICLCLFLHPLFLLVHYIKGFTWTVTKKVSCRSAWSPNVCVGARLWMCFCGLTGPSVWSVLLALTLCCYICPRTHIHTFSSKCVHGAERMAVGTLEYLIGRLYHHYCSHWLSASPIMTGYLLAKSKKCNGCTDARCCLSLNAKNTC